MKTQDLASATGIVRRTGDVSRDPPTAQRNEERDWGGKGISGRGGNKRNMTKVEPSVKEALLDLFLDLC